jgi:hypothetical protein
MKISNLAKYAIGITTGAAMLAACSSNGGSSLAPSGATGSMPMISHVGKLTMVNGVLMTAAHPNLAGLRGGLITPDKHHKKKAGDQFISDFGNGVVDEFDYPKSVHRIDQRRLRGSRRMHQRAVRQRKEDLLGNGFGQPYN